MLYTREKEGRVQGEHAPLYHVVSLGFFAQFNSEYSVVQHPLSTTNRFETTAA